MKNYVEFFFILKHSNKQTFEKKLVFQEIEKKRKIN